ncbi:DUF4330 domain-containing protein [Tyzzerella sp. OttesenSCG-928-J15]|nr:DUF4330 domain-containing protein [Tyzzerella sp. OttesenSCG-928-J15]
MIIDKDAKIFGKINIIDLCIVLVVIAGVIFAAVKFTDGATTVISGGSDMRHYEMKFFVEEVENFRVENMQIGDNLYDDSKNLFLGKITNLDINDAIIYNADAEGNTVKSDKPGYSSMEITTELDATPFENGVNINGNRYGVGHSLTIRAGKSFIYLRISAVNEK